MFKMSRPAAKSALWDSPHLFVFLIALTGGVLAASNTTTNSSNNDILNLINPFIGSANGGNVFAGATRPYGMAKAVADSYIDNTGVFALEGNPVQGFSAMHDSGTRGNPSLGNFSLFPELCPGDVVDNCNFRLGDRVVNYVNGQRLGRRQPGALRADLESGIAAEMTTSEHAAVFRFTYPQNATEKNPFVLLDLTDMWQSRQNASISVSSGSDESSTTGRMTDNGTFFPSVGAGSYVMYFCADFYGGKVLNRGVWVNNRAGTESKELFVTRGFNYFYLEAGGWARFEDLGDDNTITARVGTSFISAEQACGNAEDEIPDPVGGFDQLVEVTKDLRREKLETVSISPRARAWICRRVLIPHHDLAAGLLGLGNTANHLQRGLRLGRIRP
ncbi:hypothetical protein F4801DRAFT_287001 [Xylaria longipes]|nr:hypothetical protein F4801DRAFT_287001 [Xylaria longipes]